MNPFAEQESPDSDPSDLTGAFRRLPHTAGWMLLVNLFLGSLFFLELQWYLESIYRFSPWIPFLSYERIDTVIDVLWGAFMVHVGAPLARGKLDILSHPEKFFGKGAFGLFCHRRTAAVAVALVAGVYCLIVFSPALHLVHSSVGDPPVVVVGGSRTQFQGTSVPLRGSMMQVDRTETVVSGKHRFLRVRLYPDDVETYRLFPTHNRIDLDRFFLRRNLVSTLTDAGGRELASFTFDHRADEGITTQCVGSALQQQLADDDPRACLTLLRSIVADMSSRPEARLLRDYQGSVHYEGRIYRYAYAFGPELRLSIRAPEANSELANSPREALERFRSAGADDRELLVSEFGKDVSSLSSRALEEVFEGLYASRDLVPNLTGTRSRRMDTLLFARDILALGVDHVPIEAVRDLVERILRVNLVPSADDRVFVPAVGAMIALTRGAPGLRSMVLEEVEGFVTAPGNRRSASAPAIAGILLQALDDRTGPADSDRILATLDSMRSNTRSSSPAIQLINSQIRERIGQLTDSTVADELREVLEVRSVPAAEEKEQEAPDHL